MVLLLHDSLNKPISVLAHNNVEYCYCVRCLEASDKAWCARLRTVSTARTSYTEKPTNWLHNESSPQRSAGSRLLLLMPTLLNHTVCIPTGHYRSPVNVAVVVVVNAVIFVLQQSARAVHAAGRGSEDEDDGNGESSVSMWLRVGKAALFGVRSSS